MSAISNSRKQAAAKKAGLVARMRMRVFGAMADRPVESAVGAVFAALMTGVLLNALVLQSARHPSPLFGAPVSAGPTASISLAPEMPKPVPRPTTIPAVQMAAPLAAPSAIATRPVTAPHEAEPATTRNPDAIGDMLRSGPAPAASSAVEARRILLVQKALMKLGYITRPDGVFGATTHQAIELFERERGWPGRGELTPKVLREISARSGISIE